MKLSSNSMFRSSILASDAKLWKTWPKWTVEKGKIKVWCIAGCIIKSGTFWLAYFTSHDHLIRLYHWGLFIYFAPNLPVTFCIICMNTHTYIYRTLKRQLIFPAEKQLRYRISQKFYSLPVSLRHPIFKVYRDFNLSY